MAKLEDLASKHKLDLILMFLRFTLCALRYAPCVLMCLWSLTSEAPTSDLCGSDLCL